jgi:hypothetical protein
MRNQSRGKAVVLPHDRADEGVCPYVFEDSPKKISD